MTDVARDVDRRPDPEMARRVAAAQRGDRDAFGDIYTAYARAVRGVLRARVAPAYVDDLLQDVFMTALARLSSLRDAAALGGWLMTIARNRAIDHLRRAPPTVELVEDPPSSAPDQQDEAEAHAILALIRRLPDAYRETLTLRLVEGMTGPEIAARTGLTEGSVRVNLHRGMKQLREHLNRKIRVSGSEHGIRPSGDYLWDRSGTPDPDVEHLEHVLGVLGREEPRPFQVPPHAATPNGPNGPNGMSGSFAPILLAQAAGVALLVGATLWIRPTPVTSMDVTTLAGTPTIGSQPMADRGQLPVGHWLVTDAQSRANIDVGTIGRVEVDSGSRVSLLSTRPGDYRLRLDRGTMHALIWAPPGQFFVETSSATAVDLGCAYTLTVDDDGEGVVRVTSGWVGFEWRGRESFIPAGAVCRTRRGVGPGTPHREDASDAFREALDTIDLGRAPVVARLAALNLVLDEAQPEDAFTLWHLLTRVEAGARDRVFDRLAGFVAPPASVTREGVRGGDRDMLDQWWDALGLGSANWWRVWKQPWRDGWPKAR